MLKPIPSFELIEEFAAEASQLFRILSDAERWPEGSIARVLVVREPGYVQLAFLNRSRASVDVKALGIGRCSVSVSHELLTEKGSVSTQKVFWQQHFDALRKQVER